MMHRGIVVGLAFTIAMLFSCNASAQTSKPTIRRVENVASYSAGPISPGEMIVIFGGALGPAEVIEKQLDSQGRIATTLSEVQVLFDGVAAPLIYVSSEQISAMVPFGLTGKTATQVQVRYRGVASDPFQKTLAVSAPGIFTVDASGKGQAAMANSDGSYNSPTNPAALGSFVTFYVTGEGQTNPPGFDGNIAASPANVILPVTVRIGGRVAQILYAGSAPGAVNGFAQINAVIPSDLQFGGNLPLTVQIGATLSQLEVTMSVAQVPTPTAPPTLQAAPLSSSQIRLTWNAGTTTEIVRYRIERRIATGSFVEVNLPGSAATSLDDSGLNSATTYFYRMRTETTAGLTPYSNEATATTMQGVSTAPLPKTIFLIHGLGQDSQSMRGLFDSLIGPLGIDRTRFGVNAAFDFRECANTTFCSSNCSISAGAQKLAQFILDARPPGDIVLVGFSMGGLIARDMMANNRLGVLNGRKVAALITLGTPNLGYPYTFIDTAGLCTPLVQAMNGNWRVQQAQNTVVLSPYLSSLTNQWSSIAYPGSSGVWLAAAGRSCANPKRTLDTSTGCRDSNPYSDGVVCNDSATYSVGTTAVAKPSLYWQDPGQIYVHSHDSLTGLLLCGNTRDPAKNPLLSNPPVWDSLFGAIKAAINGL